MSRAPSPEGVLKAAFGAKSHMQGYRDQLNPTSDGRTLTDLLTLTLLVSCYGANRYLQSNSFQQFCDEVRGGPPKQYATGSDIIARLRIPPEANVRISYREHRMRATLSTPGMMAGSGNLLILNDHAPVSLTTAWSARIGNVDEPLILADVVPGLPELVVSTLKRGTTHVMLDYVDEEVPWIEAERIMAERIADRTEGPA